MTDRTGKKTLATPYPVVAGGRPGECFAWTLWGGGRVRWYWVRHDDGTEKAYPLGALAIKPVVSTP